MLFRSDISNTLNIGDEISLITDKDGKRNYNIIDINSNQFKIDKDIEGSNCLVYGTKVNDFHTLDKSYIYTLNVCATQDLYKLIQQQQEQIDDLKEQIKTLMLLLK